MFVGRNDSSSDADVLRVVVRVLLCSVGVMIHGATFFEQCFFGTFTLAMVNKWSFISSTLSFVSKRRGQNEVRSV